MSVMDVRREIIPLLWSTSLGKRASPNVLVLINMGNTKSLCVCRRTKLPGRGVHSEKVREIGKRYVREEVVGVVDSL